MVAQKSLFKSDEGEISQDKESFSCKSQLAGYLVPGLFEKKEKKKKVNEYIYNCIDFSFPH